MKGLRRCRKNLEADNVVLIDEDTDNLNNVIDLDKLESFTITKNGGGPSGSTNNKNGPSRTYINIDDDESPSERNYENVASNISPLKVPKGKRTYGLSTQSEDDENIDCEVMEKSSGKEWERAFLKRKGDVNNDHIGNLNKDKQIALDIQAEKAQQLQKRQKQREEERRETQKKDEENKNLNDQYREKVIEELKKLKISCPDMASLLRDLGILVGDGPCPSSNEVRAAYKKALRSFHPDKTTRSDMRQQVEAEEKFKLITSMKEKLPL